MESGNGEKNFEDVEAAEKGELSKTLLVKKNVSKLFRSRTALFYPFQSAHP